MLPFTNRLNAYFSEDSQEENTPIENKEELFKNINNYAFLIQGYLEIMLNREMTIEEQRNYLIKVHKESYKLNHALNCYCQTL